MLKISEDMRRDLVKQAHPLKPVIMVGNKGITDSLIIEMGRTLDTHQLIKVKIASTDRDERHAIADQLATACDAALLREIGKIAIYYRPKDEKKP